MTHRNSCQDTHGSGCHFEFSWAPQFLYLSQSLQRLTEDLSKKIFVGGLSPSVGSGKSYDPFNFYSANYIYFSAFSEKTKTGSPAEGPHFLVTLFVLALSHTGIASHHTFQLNGLHQNAFAHMALFVGNVHRFSRQWQLGYLPSSNSCCLW